MINVEEELKKVKLTLEPRPGHRQAIVAQLNPALKPSRLIERGIALCLILSLSLAILSLARSNLDLLIRMVSAEPSSLRHLSLVGSVILAATPWLCLLALLGTTATLKFIRIFKQGQIMRAHRESFISKLSLAPRTAFLGAAMATVTLTGASAYGLYKTDHNSAEQRRQIEHRILLQSGVQVNDNEANHPAPWRVSKIKLPLCDESSAEVCMYRFGEMNGGDNIVIPPAYLQDPVKMEQLGQVLFDQTKNIPDSIKIIIYTDRRAAQLLPQLLKSQRSETEMSQTDIDWSTSHYKAQFEASPGYAVLRYWPISNAESKQIEYGHKPGPSEAEIQARKAIEQSSAKQIDYKNGTVTAVLPDGYEIAGGKNPNTHYRITVDGKTQYRSSGDVKIDRSQIKVGSIIYTVGRHFNGDDSPELARLVINDAGAINRQGGVEFDWYGIDLRPYEEQLLAE